MAKPEWGTKRTCHHCGARFYDLRREAIVCPMCSTPFDPERQPRSRKSAATPRADAVAASAVRAATVQKASPEEEILEDEAVETDADGGEGATAADDLEDADAENEDLIEDTSDLGQDDDDIGEVIEHIDDDVEDKS